MTRDDALKIFSVGFSKFLTRKGLTQARAGEILNVSTTTIHFIKSGKNFPSVEGIFTLIDHGMNLNEIFGEERAKKLMESYKIECADVENIDIFKELPNPAGMTEEEFDQKMKGSLMRLLGNLDIRK